MSKTTPQIIEDDGITAMHMREIISRLVNMVVEPQVSGKDTISSLSASQIDCNIMEIEPEGIVNDGTTGATTSDIIIHNGFSHAPLLEQANMAWQEREASSRCLYDHCPLGIFRVSLDGTTLAVNAEMARIIGCDTPAEAVRYFNNLTDQFFVNPNRKQEYIALLQKTGAVKGFEFEAGKKQGEIIWVSVDARLVLVDEESGPAREEIIHGFVTDITGKKLAEEALRKSEAQYRRIVDTAREGIWDLDKNWQTSFVNPHLAAMLGYEPDEMLGRVIDDFIFVEDMADHFQRKQERQQGKDGQYERRFRSKEGSDIWTIVSSTAQMDKEGQFAGSFAMLTNITKRKKSEVEKDTIQAQLEHASKMESVGRLAGGVAHDFNNMLSVIIGNAELALYQIEKDSVIHKELEEIKKAALRSAELTRRLLAFARKQAVAPRVINLNQTIDGMLKMLHRLIGEDISLTWLPQIGLRSIFIDPSQVDQILVNLCVNARDAIQGVGKITIETQNITLNDDYCRENPGVIQGEYVLLSFRDNGCGIPKEHLKQVFEPFFTTKKPGEGTGLGLSMIYGIIKQNGGLTTITSEQEKGTTFRIYLPQQEGESEEVQHSMGLDIPPGQGETILLVEDETAILALNKKMLERIGYRVLATSSSVKALHLASKHREKIKILITDVIMPDMNGYDLAQKLWKTKPDLKCLFVSGYPDNVVSRQGFLPEGLHFLQKPFMERDLAVKIREMLNR